MDRVQVILKVPKELVGSVKKALDINGYANIGELTKKLWREWLEKYTWCIIDQRFHCPTPEFGLRNCAIGGILCPYLRMAKIRLCERSRLANWRK